jgi:hypothetical protein
MDNELIKMTHFGANVEHPWEQTNIMSTKGTVLSTRECSCWCSSCGVSGDTDAAICFPGY